jgi:L-malate glycosyltransferase
MKLKIAILLPSLANVGSIIVAKDIVNNTLKLYPDFADFTVFYFDDKFELDLNCETKKLNFKEPYVFKEFQIVHAHGYRPDRFLSRNKSLINSKIMSTIHCNVFEDLNYSYGKLVSLIYGRFWLYYLSNLDRVITLTNTHKTFYQKYINNKKLRVVYNGRLIDAGDIPQSDKLLFKNIRETFPNSTLVGAFAVLNKRKGLDQIIKVLPDLKNHVLVVLGDGTLMKKLKVLSKKLGVDNRCFFLGYKKDANKYMPYIDVYALPSFSEAFPLSLIEACYSGVSSVCSNIPVLEEVYTDNEVTFFELNNIKSLQYAIERATKEKNILGTNAKFKTQNNYSMKQMIKNYKNVYENLIN